MGTGTDEGLMNYIKYNPIRIKRYYYTLPLWRRILMKFTEKYRIGKEEYDTWVYEDIFN